MAVAKTSSNPSVHSSLVVVGSSTASHRPHPWQRRGWEIGEGEGEKGGGRGKGGDREGRGREGR